MRSFALLLLIAALAQIVRADDPTANLPGVVDLSELAP
jgi:hypothetical protein